MLKLQEGINIRTKFKHYLYTVEWLAFEDAKFWGFNGVYRTLKIFVLEIIRSPSSTAYYILADPQNKFTKYSV